MNWYWLAAVSVLLSSGGQLLLKAGAVRSGAAAIVAPGNMVTCARVLASPEIIAGLICWGLSTFVWILVLAKAPLSHACGFGAVNYVLVPLGARWLFGEPLYRAHIPGFLLITIGVFVITWANRNGGGHAIP